MGIGGAVGLAVGDAIWEGGEQVCNTVRDAWNWLVGKLSKLREYNAMFEELGVVVPLLRIGESMRWQRLARVEKIADSGRQ
ncbi:MAG: hypothetical protein KatS3mg022_2359 [Armatimonadota bacterium]|nr:MAG: hypothetical protein KatS3mg022_2359 [Armatimonadota bacterium]